MKGDVIPDKDDIARYCKASYIQQDGCVSGDAFKLRPEEDFLSVSWLNYWRKGSFEENIAATRNALQRKLKISRKAKLAVVNVGSMRENVQQALSGETVSVLHEPSSTDPSHSGIYGTNSIENLEEAIVAEILAGGISSHQVYFAISE